MTTSDPVTGATQDRAMIAAKAIADRYGHGTRMYEEDGRIVVAALDAADAAAGIRRVTVGELNALILSGGAS